MSARVCSTGSIEAIAVGCAVRTSYLRTLGNDANRLPSPTCEGDRSPKVTPPIPVRTSHPTSSSYELSG